jgi:hypothetical protein
VLSAPAGWARKKERDENVSILSGRTSGSERWIFSLENEASKVLWTVPAGHAAGEDLGNLSRAAHHIHGCALNISIRSVVSGPNSFRQSGGGRYPLTSFAVGDHFRWRLFRLIGSIDMWSALTDLPLKSWSALYVDFMLLRVDCASLLNTVRVS